MFSIDHLCANSISTLDLDKYLSANISELTFFFDSDYSSLIPFRWKIVDCIIEYEQSIIDLDFSEYYNSLFVLTLLEFSERYKLQGSYDALYNISINNHLQVGHRQKASKLYLLETNFHNDHLKIFSKVITNLQIAYETEEDSELNVLATFGNYFLNAVLNTAEINTEITRKIIQKIIKERNNYSFLLFDFIDSIISITPNATKQYSNKIQLLIEQLLLQQKTITSVSDDFIIEEGTEYVGKIKNVNSDFNSIRNISMKIFNSYSQDKKLKLISSLLRGVKIIDDEEQLYAYLTLFGAKHKTKLHFAFSYLKQLPQKYNIIDWACGQGLATMIFLDKFGNKDVQQVVLNEPSELALKRTSLHLNKYSIICSTINKRIDHLITKDVSINDNVPYIHLFSNILDIKLDLNYLTTLIDNSCSGENYFLCVSPYMGDLKKNRMELFVNHFRVKYLQTFELIGDSEKRNGDPTWVIIVFKVII